jgi:hypothetical protein
MIVKQAIVCRNAVLEAPLAVYTALTTTCANTILLDIHCMHTLSHKYVVLMLYVLLTVRAIPLMIGVVVQQHPSHC